MLGKVDIQVWTQLCSYAQDLSIFLPNVIKIDP